MRKGAATSHDEHTETIIGRPREQVIADGLRWCKLVLIGRMDELAAAAAALDSSHVPASLFRG
jgi:hypothetical protein